MPLEAFELLHSIFKFDTIVSSPEDSGSSMTGDYIESFEDNI